MNKLEDFQEEGATKLAISLLTNQSVIGVSPTGSGKTVIMATIAARFVAKSKKQVVILVHRTELVDQTREKLFSWYGIYAQKIDADTKDIKDADVYVAMVETFNNRIKNPRFMNLFKDVGLLMVDECHISNFKKIFIPFAERKRIGFTATPISATKKDPLKNYYQDMVIVATQSQVLELNQRNPLRGVVPALEYSFPESPRAKLKLKGGEFDENEMGKEFKKPRQIQNTIDAYIKYAAGTKTICFNASIDHSIEMMNAFIAAGFNARHIDSDAKSKYSGDAWRKDCFKWLKETPNAILCNVGIATTGFDETSIETVIVNKSTTSFSLWKQMIGRGGRPHLYADGSHKEFFRIIDMGDNMSVTGGGFGSYESDVDWRELFDNPKIPKPGVPVVKICPKCNGIIFASARYCTAKDIDFLTEELVECGHVFPAPSKEEDFVKRTVVLVSSSIDVSKNIEFFSDSHEYRAFYETISQVCNSFRQNMEDTYLDAWQVN